MNFSLTPRKLMLYLLITSSVNCIAQDKPASTDLLADTSARKESEARHSVYSGLGYGSNMVYMGSTISMDHPFEYASLVYGFKDELFLSVSGYHLHEMKPFAAFCSATASYNHIVNSWLDYSLSLSGYHVDRSLVDTLFAGFVYGDITLGFDWNILYTKISFSGLISEENRGYIQIRNSRYFETPYFIKGKVSVSFDPYVNLLTGSMVKVRTNNSAAKKASPAFKPWHKNNTGTGTTYTDVFGPIEIDCGLPVAINFERFTVEAEAAYLFPFYSDDSYLNPKGFIFLLSAFMRIF